jgi:hypothetical protein
MCTTEEEDLHARQFLAEVAPGVSNQEREQICKDSFIILKHSVPSRRNGHWGTERHLLAAENVLAANSK